MSASQATAEQIWRALAIKKIVKGSMAICQKGSFVWFRVSLGHAVFLTGSTCCPIWGVCLPPGVNFHEIEDKGAAKMPVSFVFFPLVAQSLSSFAGRGISKKKSG